MVKRQIWTDKLQLYNIMLEKLMNVIHQYNNIYRKFYEEAIIDDESLKTDDDWKFCWQNLAELFDFLEFEYLNEFDRAKPGELGEYEPQDIKDKLSAIMRKYRSTHANMKLSELDFTYRHIKFLTTKVGLHSMDQKQSYDAMDMLMDDDVDFGFVDKELAELDKNS